MPGAVFTERYSRMPRSSIIAATQKGFTEFHLAGSECPVLISDNRGSRIILAQISPVSG